MTTTHTQSSFRAVRAVSLHAQSLLQDTSVENTNPTIDGMVCTAEHGDHCTVSPSVDQSTAQQPGIDADEVTSPLRSPLPTCRRRAANQDAPAERPAARRRLSLAAAAAAVAQQVQAADVEGCTQAAASAPALRELSQPMHSSQPGQSQPSQGSRHLGTQQSSTSTQRRASTKQRQNFVRSNVSNVRA